MGLTTSSLCIYSDAINNLFDTLGCAVAVAGLLLSTRKASEKYPDGLGRAEDLTGFIMAVCVAFTGFYFAYLALERFFYPRPVNFLVRHAVLLGITAVIKLLLGFIFFRLYKKRKSIIIKTVYTDSFADFGVTAMTLISFILSEYSGLRADSVFGLILSTFIIVNAIRLVISSARIILGENDRGQIELAEKCAIESGYKNCSAKFYKTGSKITCCITIEGDGDFESAERLIKENTGADLFIKRRLTQWQRTKQ